MIDGPAEAAGYLTALTLGQVNNRGIFGLIRLSGEDLETIIMGGLDVFLRAYRAS